MEDTKDVWMKLTEVIAKKTYRSRDLIADVMKLKQFLQTFPEDRTGEPQDDRPYDGTVPVNTIDLLDMIIQHLNHGDERAAQEAFFDVFDEDPDTSDYIGDNLDEYPTVAKFLGYSPTRRWTGSFYISK